MNPQYGPPLIFLVGYRGSGKSTVGPRLAAELGWDFVDADDVIEARAGQSIAAIPARPPRNVPRNTGTNPSH